LKNRFSLGVYYLKKNERSEEKSHHIFSPLVFAPNSQNWSSVFLHSLLYYISLTLHRERTNMVCLFSISRSEFNKFLGIGWKIIWLGLVSIIGFKISSTTIILCQKQANVLFLVYIFFTHILAWVGPGISLTVYCHTSIFFLIFFRYAILSHHTTNNRTLCMVQEKE